MTTAVTVATGGIEEFKLGVDALLEKRRCFREKILPALIAGKDYFIIKGRKSLGKAGAEKLASLYQLVATFEKDTETMESFKNIDGLVAYKCTLSRDGVVVGEGRGAAVLKEHDSVNTTIRLSEKRCFVGAVIRATGCSDVFTSDIEDMPIASIQSHTTVEERPRHTDEASNEDDHYQSYERAANEEGGVEEVPEDPHAMTKKQRDFLMSLIAERISGKEQTEEWLSRLDSGLSISDASELISSLIPAR